MSSTFCQKANRGAAKKKIMGPGSSTRFQHIPLLPVDRRILVGNLPSLTASLALKMDGWKMKCPFWDPAYFQGRTVSFRESTWVFIPNKIPGIQSPCQRMIGMYNHFLSKVFRFHYHSQKVIGSLGKYLGSFPQQLIL